MKTLVLIIICFLSVSEVYAQDNFLRCSANENNTQIVRIYKENSKYLGKILYLENGSKFEAKNEIILIKMKKK